MILLNNIRIFIIDGSMATIQSAGAQRIQLIHRNNFDIKSLADKVANINILRFELDRLPLGF